MQISGHLDHVVRVNVNSFLLRGWSSDCRPESTLRIESQSHETVVVRLNDQYQRIARPDVIAAMGCDQSILRCGFLVEVNLPEGFTPSLVHLAGLPVRWPLPDELDYELRQSLMGLCDAFFWQPQCLGFSSAAIGLEEALDEIVRVRLRESFALAGEMVRCCRDHGFSHPLLDDNEAWIAYEACEFERAESIWRTLTSSEVAGIADQANATLRQLFQSPSVKVRLADVARLRARQSPDVLWRQRILQAWLQADDEEDQDLVFKALKEIALDIGLSSANVCDPDLMAMSLIASLCDEGLQFLGI